MGLCGKSTCYLLGASPVPYVPPRRWLPAHQAPRNPALHPPLHHQQLPQLPQAAASVPPAAWWQPQKIWLAGHFLVRRAKIRYSDNQNTSEKSSISAESSRRDTSKSEVFSVLGALACTHDLLKVRPKCHYGVSFAQQLSLAKAITLANLAMHIYEVWPAGTPK